MSYERNDTVGSEEEIVFAQPEGRCAKIMNDDYDGNLLDCATDAVENNSPGNERSYYYIPGRGNGMFKDRLERRFKKEKCLLINLLKNVYILAVSLIGT